MIILKNGTIVKEDEVFKGSVAIEDDKIIKILRDSEDLSEFKDAEIIDVDGYYITPGLIDIHSDYIENIISPRPITMMDNMFSLREAERILLTCGITTMYHSISLYPEDEYGRKEVRNPKNVIKLIEDINKLDSEPHIIHNKVHLRYEVCNTTQVDEIKKLMEEGKIHLFSVMDHTPGQGQYKNLKIYKDTMKSYDAKLSEEDLDDDIESKKARKKLSIEDIKDFINYATDRDISVASHDDDSIEKLEFMKDLGIRISEFPLNLEVAREAKKKGLYTIAGAPNLMMGKSHSGNLSAREGVLDGSISMISSDYYPSAMLVSIFNMWENYGVDLNEMFNMVTINPARATGIGDEVGSIEEGKYADLLVINKKGKFPAIKMAFIDGHKVLETSYRYDN